MPLVVKLSMIVALELDSRRQLNSDCTMRASQMCRAPTGRRGFEQFTTLQAQQRAAQRASYSDSKT